MKGRKKVKSEDLAVSFLVGKNKKTAEKELG